MGSLLKRLFGAFFVGGGKRYAIDYYQHSEDLDPLGPEFGEHKVIRGGCYFQGVSRLRCASDRLQVCCKV